NNDVGIMFSDMIVVLLSVISAFAVATPTTSSPPVTGTTPMALQGFDPFFSLYQVNSNHRRLARKLYCRDKSIQLVAIQAGFELLACLPFFHEQKVFWLIQID